jgi:hypothetical protein
VWDDVVQTWQKILRVTVIRSSTGVRSKQVAVTQILNVRLLHFKAVDPWLSKKAILDL